MSRLFAELKRRNVFRIAVAYLIAGWLITEVSSVLLPAFEAPGWVLRVIVMLLLIGFPMAIALSWIYELTPEGIKREADIDRSRSITRESGRRLDLFTIALVVVGIGFLLLDRFVLERTPDAESPPEPPHVVARQARSGEVTDHSNVEPSSQPRSIAVLPFVNMSSDPEQEYFSDGMTEELLNVLVKVPGILVAARTSAFSYKGQDRDVREIGRELGVQHIVEGSVRKAGNDLRITAQLIRVADGFHLWSESYDRKLENVFVIQEEIARSIAAALQTPLGLASEELVPNRTVDVDNYTRYLEARRLLRLRAPYLDEGIEILQDLVLREPDYAPAWASLAFGLDVLTGYQDTLGGRPIDELRLRELVVDAAQRAVTLDPSLPEGRHALANALRAVGRWSEAEDAYRAAIALDPESVEILEDWRQFLAETGRINDSVVEARRVHDLDPRAALAVVTLADSLFVARQFDESRAMAEQALELQHDFVWPQILLFEMDLIAGNFERAGQRYRSCAECRRFSWSEDVLEAIQALEDDAAEAFDGTRILEAQYPELWYRIGGADLVLSALEHNQQQSAAGLITYRFTYANNPFMDEVRSDPRFHVLMQRFGLVDFWRERGWPDICRPLDDEGFQCGAYRGEGP